MCFFFVCKAAGNKVWVKAEEVRQGWKRRTHKHTLDDVLVDEVRVFGVQVSVQKKQTKNNNMNLSQLEFSPCFFMQAKLKKKSDDIKYHLISDKLSSKCFIWQGNCGASSIQKKHAVAKSRKTEFLKTGRASAHYKINIRSDLRKLLTKRWANRFSTVLRA